MKQTERQIQRSKLFLSISENKFSEIFDLDQYHSYDEIVEYMKSIEKKNSSTLVISLKSIGKTYEERDIYVLAISKQSLVKKKVIFKIHHYKNGFLSIN